MPTRVIPAELLAYLGAAELLAGWLETSPRFAAFVDEYRDKVRKKLRSARDPDAVQDVLCELETAFYLLREPRFSIAYEAYAATQQRAPDFTITYRTHTACHVEAARLRASPALDAEAPRRVLRQAQDARVMPLGRITQMRAGVARPKGAEPNPPGQRAAQNSHRDDDEHAGQRKMFDTKTEAGNVEAVTVERACDDEQGEQT